MGAIAYAAVHTATDEDIRTIPKGCAPSFSDTSQTFSGQVCRFLPRNERDRRAYAIDEACKVARVSNASLAAMLDVSPTFARKLRTGDAGLTDERIARLSTRLRAAYAVALAQPQQLALDFGRKRK